MRTRFILYVIITVLIASGCNKETNYGIPPANCDKTPQERIRELLGPDVGYIITFSEDRIQYMAPYFNPLNGDEFVYYHKDNEENTRRIIKYNLATQEETVIAENSIKNENQLKWSRSGWIAYEGQDYQLWAVKENGDSLHTVTQVSTNLYPAWDADGRNLYYQYSPVLAVPYYFLRLDVMTSGIDTIFRDGDLHNGFVHRADISSNNRLVALTSFDNVPGIGIMDLNEEPLQFEKLPDIDVLEQHGGNIGGITGIAISPDGSYSYVTVSLPIGNSFGGLYRINNATGENKKLMHFCWNKRYEKISVSPEGRYLIGERVDSFTRPNALDVIVENSSIYLIDIWMMEEIPILTEEY